MLDWLKLILGDTYTEEIDKKVSKEIGTQFVPKADFNTANEAKKTAEATITERDKQIVELSKVDPAALNAKITELTTANAAAKAEHDKQISQLKIDTKIDAGLAAAGVTGEKKLKAVKALLDSTKITLDGDNLIGFNEQVNPLKESEKWAFGAVQQAPNRFGLQHQDPPPAGDTVDAEIASALFGGAK